MASGFGGQPLKEGQKRFAHSMDDFCALLTKLNIQKDNYKLGMALHSLRAVTAKTMTAAIRHLESLDQNAPIHIHISEQMKEVDDCTAWSGKRPVEWLFDNAKIDARWCLIHATHLKGNEVDLIANSGATVGICPTTEANLGDGLFPLKDYRAKNGSIAIGSDSHISVSPVEELRLLEYGQRLSHKGRNIAATAQNIHTGDALYHATLSGGAKASGFNHGAIEAGMRADIITLDAASPLLAGTPDECLLDRFIFNGNQNMVRNVMVLGKFCVENYRHFDETKITADYIALVKKLQKRVE
jgi:formimidoylglutamate deiminase